MKKLILTYERYDEIMVQVMSSIDKRKQNEQFSSCTTEKQECMKCMSRKDSIRSHCSIKELSDVIYRAHKRKGTGKWR
jgi:hypothetical protein